MQMKLKLGAAAALTLVSGLAAAQDTQVVRIGHVAPVSGAQAHYGKDNENGFAWPLKTSMVKTS